MAELTCSSCQRSLAPGQPLCVCGTPVPRGRRRRAMPSAPAEQPEPEVVAAGCTHEHLPAGIPLCDCGAFVGGAPSTPVAAAEAHSVVLTLPWGSHRLEPGQQVEIGRDVGPFQQHLADYTHVSRRHATLRLTSDGVMLVQDHASMNGTFLDRDRCPPTGANEVSDGSEIGCGSTLTIRVRFER